MVDLIDRVRAQVYGAFAHTGRAPSFADLARGLGESDERIRRAVEALADRHLLILTPDGTAIERALPFADVPTAFRVIGADVTWWANCVWDALAIPALIATPVAIDSTCGDCGANLRVRVDPARGPDRSDLVAHFLIPASRWHEDIRHT